MISFYYGQSTVVLGTERVFILSSVLRPIRRHSDDDTFLTSSKAGVDDSIAISSSTQLPAKASLFTVSLDLI